MQSQMQMHLKSQMQSQMHLHPQRALLPYPLRGGACAARCSCAQYTVAPQGRGLTP